MNVGSFVDVVMSLQAPGAEAKDFGIILFLADVSGASNWGASDVIKTYESLTAVGTDFSVTTRAYKAASKVFSQTPSIKKFQVGRRDSGQAVGSALDIITPVDNSWYCLIGMRGADIVPAADWCEANKKLHICSDENPFCLTNATTDPASLLSGAGYLRSAFFYHHQAGTKLTNVGISVTSGIATVSADSVAQSEKVTVTTIVDSTDYTITLNGVACVFNSGVGATDLFIRDGLITQIEASSVAAAFIVVIGATAAELIITAVDLGTPFTIAVDANLTLVNLVANLEKIHNRRSGDPIVVFGAVPAALNGEFTVKTVISADQFTYVPTATVVDGNATGTIEIMGGFSEPDAAMAGMGLAFQPGTIDWCHKSMSGVVVTPATILTADAITNLKAKKANYYHKTGGKHLLYKGLTAKGVYLDVVVGLLDWMTNKIQMEVFNFITSQKKVSMSDTSLTGVQNLMNMVMGSAQELELTAPFIENKAKFPDTGYPKAAREGDHFVARVPLVSDILPTDRQNRIVPTGIQFDAQSSGGIHGLTITGEVIE